jgi:hypothetical protein
VTELSLNHHLDGQEVLIPLVVPTLSREELNHLLSGGGFTEAIIAKAEAHARERRDRKLPFFALPGEFYPLPQSPAFR